MTLTNYSNYVPILKWKQGEQIAIKHLTEEIADSITPYLNVMTYDKQTESSTGFKKYLNNKRPFYLNNHFNLEDQTGELIELFEELLSLDYHPIPVVSPSSPDELLEYLSENKSKFPRMLIHLKEKETQTNSHSLTKFVSKIGIRPENCDLLIDLFTIDPKVNSDIYVDYSAKALSELSKLPFRSTIFSASSFPEMIQQIKSDDIGQFQRLEWIIYLDLIKTYPKLIFSDYGNDDPFDVISDHGYKLVPTIRYTSDSHWIIYRGHHDKNKPNDFTQFHELSRKLVRDNTIFQGKEYSWGNQIIYECSLITTCKIKCNHSHLPEWVKRTMNHHLTYVTRQVSCLSSLSSTIEHTR